MRKNTHKRKILLSFVGTNDSGKMSGAVDGAILTVFKKRRFDEVHLLWNYSAAKNVAFEKIAIYVKGEIIARGLCPTVTLHRFECDDVTDHNEIYPKLLAFCKSLKPGEDKKFTAAIASGTPAMQVCWILMAESGDFPIELIRSNEPRFGKLPVTPIRLGTGLPRIIRLERQNEFLRKEKDNLIPDVTITISKGIISIAGVVIPFSPVEFAYYRYFAERATSGKEAERFSGISVSEDFLKKVIEFHKESFPESDLFRVPLESMVKHKQPLDIRTFRANISKANARLKKVLPNSSWVSVFKIGVEGKRHAKFYGIRAPARRIRILP